MKKSHRVIAGFAVTLVLAQVVFIGGSAFQLTHAQEADQTVIQDSGVPSGDTSGGDTLVAPATDSGSSDSGAVVDGSIPAPSDVSAENTGTTLGEFTSESALPAPDTDDLFAPSQPAAAPITSADPPELTTDKPDYHPGEVATIWGKFFGALESVMLKIFGGSADEGNYTETNANVTADQGGKFTYGYQLDNVYRPLYNVVASTIDGVQLAQTTFTDANPATDISQCQNGGIGDPLQPCSETAPFAAASGYGYEGNAAANSGNSHWFEGDFVPLRIVATNYSNGSGSIQFSIDVTKGGKHAYDYIGSFDATETTDASTTTHFDHNNPVGDVIVGANPAAPDSFGVIPSAALSPFPAACGSNTFASSSSQTAGSIKAWGTSGDLTVTYVSQNVGSSDCTTIIQVAWTATKAGFGGTIVIAYAPHIARQADWGTGNSAISISGSPYHSSLVQRTTGGDTKSIGHQDAKLAASAIVVPALTGLITITKDTVPNDAQDFSFSGTLGSFLLDDDADGALSNTTSSANLADGTYSVTEAATAGFDLTNIVCADGSGGTTVSTSTRTATIGLSGGETVTCTFTNTKNATLTLVKTVTNNNGGNATTTDFQAKIDGNNVPWGVAQVVSSTSHTASEVMNVSGYTAGPWGGDCAANGTVTLAAGEAKTCTITNDDNAPQLHLRKTVTNDNGGSAANTAWTLTATGTGGSPTNLSGSTPVDSGASFKADTYALAESGGPSGYTAGAWDCGGATMPDATHVTVPLGGNVTCTINNNDNAPALHLRKVVTNDNGGTATVANFTLTANGTGSNDLSGTSPVDSGAGLLADTWVLSETSPAGYSASAWVCVGGTQGDATHITLGLGQSATCTITNDDQQAFIVVDKTVVNDNGGTAVANDFLLKVDGGAALDEVALPVNPGAHVASETLLSGYTAGAWGGDCDAQGNVSVALGQTKTCTITNDDIQPHLIVIKHVVNDNGGTAVAGNFTMNITGTNVSNPSSAGVESLGTNHTLDAGSYSVGESGPSGYATGFSAGCNSSIALGQTKTCTITNNDIAPTLKLVKTVVKDNGGTAVANDWDLIATGSGGFTELIPAAADATFHGVTAGVGYVLSESSVSGYAAGSWSCNGGNLQGSTITLGLNQNVTCTITNDDIAPKLHLRKIVVKDNGGTALDTAWTLNADGAGTNDLSGSTPVDSGADLKADTFALSESGGPSGYTASDWVCDGGSQGDATHVTVGIGGEATCTITNDDQQAYITVVKVVTNNNGGNSDPDDFDLTLEGGPVLSSVAVPVDPGTYTAGETLVTGYAFDGFSDDCDQSGDVTVALGESKTCTLTNNDVQPILHVIKHVINDNGGTLHAIDFSLAVNGENPTPHTFQGVEDPGTTVHLNAGPYEASEWELFGYEATYSQDCKGDIAVGEEKTCTITNDDIQPKLKLVKTVVNNNGGDAIADDFQGSVSGTDVDWDTFVGFNAGNYDADETNVSGYTPSDWGGDCAANGSVTLTVGDEKTCTITNDDQPAKITLIKAVDNDNGGTAAPDDFDPTIDSVIVLSGSTTDVDSNTAHAIDETVVSGYQFVSITGDAKCADALGGDTDELNEGEHITCTITNNDIAPKLHLRKVVTNDNGGTATVANFTLTANGTGSNDLSGTSPVDSGAGLLADTWVLSETSPAGYSASAWVCVGGSQNGSNITVGIGGEATCTITNDDIAPHLIVIKRVINDDLGLSSPSNFTMTINGVTASGGNSFPGADAPGVNKTLTSVGVYNVTESGPGGYNATFSGDCNGTIALGETKTCTITNNDFTGRMTGGGSVFTKTGDGDTVNGIVSNNIRVTHGFQIHCRLPDKNDNVEINWNDKTGKSHKFHLETLTGAVCTKEGNPAPPKNTAGGFNVFTGTGIGRYDGISGATLNFIFTDFGEPGRKDTAKYLVTTSGGSEVLDVDPKYLDQGNHQAHRF